MANNLPTTIIDPTTPYRLLVTRQDDGVATMRFFYNGVEQTSVPAAAAAGWDDAIPWAAATYFARGGYPKENFPMWDFISDPAGREAVELHVRQAANGPPQNRPISWGSEGCLLANGGFLNAMDSFITAHGDDDLRIDVVNDFPVNLTLASTESTVDEGSRFALNVRLNQAISKDIWVHIGLVGGSQATSPEAAQAQGDMTLADYRFHPDPIPNQTVDNLRHLHGVSNHANPAKKFQDGWYVEIARGSTSNQIVLDVLADQRTEGPELARFQILDYAVDAPTGDTPAKERLYSDYMQNPKILIQNGGPSIANVTFQDSSELPVVESGSNFTFRKVVHVAANWSIKYDFEAYDIPDGLKIFDTTGTYFDTGGLISGHRSGIFTVSPSTNGLMTITVTGNIDPGTLWDLVVDRASSNSPEPSSLFAHRAEGETAGAGEAPAAAAAPITAGQQATATFAQGGTAVFTATLVSGRTYSATVVASDATAVDPKLVFVDGFSTTRTYLNTETNNNAASFFTATANENVSFTVSDTFGRAGTATIALNQIAPTDVNAFVLNAINPLVVENSGDELGLQLEVQRLGNVNMTSSVSWRVVASGPNAMNAGDFGGVLPSGTLTFTPGKHSGFITLFPTADGITEGVETAVVELFNPSNGILATLRVHGQEASQQIFVGDVYDAAVTDVGTPLDDEMFGGPLADSLRALDGADKLTGFGGNDALDGGSGDDTAVFTVNRAQASWSRGASGVWTVSSPDGIDTLSSIEHLQFNDITVRLGQPPGDFNADARADILWRHNNGTTNVFLMNGPTVIGGSNTTLQVDNNWSAQDKADFNGDGRADILWRHLNGTSNIFLMDGSTVLGGSNTTQQVDNAWAVQGADDFNGDGRADILWRHQNGTSNVFLMDGPTFIGGSNTTLQVDNNWSVKGIDDFNGDGRADILWRHLNGTSNVFLMDGPTVIGGSNTTLQVDNNWSVKGVGDFDGDGKADILWRHANGTSNVFLMNGSTVIGGSNTTLQVDNNWSVADTGDYNGDGKTDILWRHANGTTNVFLMDGATVIGGSNTSLQIDNNWHVI